MWFSDARCGIVENVVRPSTMNASEEFRITGRLVFIAGTALYRRSNTFASG